MLPLTDFVGGKVCVAYETADFRWSFSVVGTFTASFSYEGFPVPNIKIKYATTRLFFYLVTSFWETHLFEIVIPWMADGLKSH